MTTLYHKLRAALISLILVTALMASLFVVHAIEPPEQLTLRRVALALPPPPPPTIARRRIASESPRLNVLPTVSDALPLLQSALVVEPISAESLPEPAFVLDAPDFQNVLTIDWQGFNLDELDDTPRLLTDLDMRFPQGMIDRGIKRFKVELSVMIDEGGRVLLRDIVLNPYPEVNDRIRSLLVRARFTPPIKDGTAAREVFIWPIEFRTDG